MELLRIYAMGPDIYDLDALLSDKETLIPEARLEYLTSLPSNACIQGTSRVCCTHSIGSISE